MGMISVSIDSIAAGGDGVGRSNGLVVFVPRTAPGDVVTAQISGKSHFARGTLRNIVTASPSRIDPPCPHYTRDKCGGCQLQHMTAIAMESIAEPFIRRRAMRHFEKGRIVIFAAGTGNPYFSTDTAAALRAIQIHADVIIKATSVDGVYSADPKRDPEAKKYDSISYRDVMIEELGVMDQTAITLCKENKLPIIVLNIHRHGEVAKALMGERVGTIVQ